MNTSMEKMDYRILYKDDIAIGLIGQETNGKVHIKSKDELSETIIKGLVTAVKIDETDQIGEIFISKSIIVHPEHPTWLTYIEYELPFNFYATPIETTTKKHFNRFNLSNVNNQVAS